MCFQMGVLEPEETLVAKVYAVVCSMYQVFQNNRVLKQFICRVGFIFLLFK